MAHCVRHAVLTWIAGTPLNGIVGFTDMLKAMYSGGQAVAAADALPSLDVIEQCAWTQVLRTRRPLLNIMVLVSRGWSTTSWTRLASSPAACRWTCRWSLSAKCFVRQWSRWPSRSLINSSVCRFSFPLSQQHRTYQCTAMQCACARFFGMDPD
jgi:hypothetical protein